jgi:hypothetical protein
MSAKICRGCKLVGPVAEVVVDVVRHDLRERYLCQLCKFCWSAMAAYLEELSFGRQASLPDQMVKRRRPPRRYTLTPYGLEMVEDFKKNGQA